MIIDIIKKNKMFKHIIWILRGKPVKKVKRGW